MAAFQNQLLINMQYQKQILDPNNGFNLKIALDWDFLKGQQVDLDATIVMIDEMGSTIDAVYYNKLTSDCGALKHSGDK